MKLKIMPSSTFQKDLKRLKKRGYDLSLLKETVRAISEGETLPPEIKDHSLSGNFQGCRECHIAPDWLLIYEIVQDELLRYLTRTGTHSDLF